MTDEQLRRDVLDELAWEPCVDVADVQVAAHAGVVTLTGTAPHYCTRLLAERVAKRVAGVKAVANDIAVLTPPAAAKTDTELAAAAVHALEWDTLVPSDRVQVTVEDGHVALEGAVEWGYQREAAEAAVRNLVGVRNLTNRLAVRPRAAGADVKGKIEAALRRCAEADAQGVTVGEDGGRVSLGGWVRSWAERDAVERAAWAALGVTDVENNMVVT